MKFIINSILDTDLYKLTMGQAVLRHHDRLKVEYQFINRGQTLFPAGFDKALQEEIDHMAHVYLRAGERKYLESSTFYYLKQSYIDWLAGYRFNPGEVKIEQAGSNLSIVIKGYWYRTIYWEVPLLAMISELYYQITSQYPTKDWIRKTKEKAERLKMRGVKFSEFGTRRRFSQHIHENETRLLRDFANPSSTGGVLNGTSNVDLARRLNLTPMGTYAHEWVMAHSAMYGIKMANTMAMETWEKEFDASLGIALTDTYTTYSFLESFTTHYAKLFDGVRHDSGSPFDFAAEMINHYKKLRINPLHKTIVFSDSLDVNKAIIINEFCKGKIQCSFGIGTHLSNDVGVKPLNMVIKMTSVTIQNQKTVQVVKLSDDDGKVTGDQEAVDNARYETQS